jgi:hypothetical protein
MVKVKDGSYLKSEGEPQAIYMYIWRAKCG